MSEITSDTDLAQLAGTEAMQLGEMAIDGQSADYLKFVQNSIGKVTRNLNMARGQHEKLLSDDTSNPKGIQRLLNELPDNIDAGTSGDLENVDSALAILEAHLRSAALSHDSTNDSSLYVELQNLTANLSPGNAMSALIHVAADSRYSTIMAGPYGASLAARFNIDHGAFTRAALQSLATTGTPMQVRAIAGLAKIPAARRVHFLAKSEASKVSGAIRARNAARGFDRGYEGPSSPGETRNATKSRAFRS